MDEKIFEITHIYFNYVNNTPGLCDVSLNIDKGETVAVLGANGSGKSTLLKILDGLYFPHKGRVRAFGSALTEKKLKDKEFSSFFRKQVGLVFQDPDVQLFLPTVKEEIAFAPLQLGLDKKEIEERVKEASEQLDISSLLNRPPYYLSGGEKKKVALASILTLDPGVWLLDEPTASLDPKTQTWVLEFLLHLKKEKKTILIATHDLEIARHSADRCIVLGEDHKVLAQGDTSSILDNRELLIKANLIRPIPFGNT